MSSLYLFQFAALVFMLVNALFVALARLNARWKNKRYERSRLMIFLALVLLSAQYYVQMRFHIRATDDHLGAMVNMLVYTPCFGLIAMAIYNLEAVQAKRRNMALACAGFYAAIVGCFALDHYLRGSWHIGGWLYPMLALYSVHMIYCVLMIRKETHKRRRMLETLTATDLLPYVRYSYASVVNLCLAALVTPVAILSTTTLYIFGPLVLMAILFFVLTFISLGTGYMPSEELLDSEGEELAEELEAGASLPPSGASACAEASTVSPSGRSALSEERIALIQERIDSWCVQRGYKDYSINFMTLSRSLSISKADLAVYFSQRLHTTFRVWLSDIRFRAAQSMMLEHPITATTWSLPSVVSPRARSSTASSRRKRDVRQLLGANASRNRTSWGDETVIFGLFLTLFKAFCGCLLPTKATPDFLSMQHLFGRNATHLCRENPPLFFGKP